MKKLWLLTTLLTAWLILTWCGSKMPDFCDHYFDWCNRCTRDSNGKITCTENKCETIGNDYCDENSYNEKYYEWLDELYREMENDPEMKEFLDDLDNLPDPEYEESNVNNGLSETDISQKDLEEIQLTWVGDIQYDTWNDFYIVEKKHKCESSWRYRDKIEEECYDNNGMQIIEISSAE